MESDLIRKSRVLEILDHAQIGANDVDEFFQWASDIVAEEPPISPDSLREHGRWEEGKRDWEAIRCSKCGGEWNLVDNCTETFNYCPSCGAKMDLEERDADTTHQKEMV